MDEIQDVLSGQARNTMALGQYQGHGPVHLDLEVRHLRQLLAKLKQLLSQFPPEIQAMLSGLIAEVEAALSSPGSMDISALIAKLERIIEVLLELIRHLTGASGQFDPAALLLLLRGLATQLDANSRAILARSLQRLRQAIATGSLKGVDESNLAGGDQQDLVEPNLDNVLQSLQELIRVSLAQVAGGSFVPTPDLSLGDQAGDSL